MVAKPKERNRVSGHRPCAAALAQTIGHVPAPSGVVQFASNSRRSLQPLLPPMKRTLLIGQNTAPAFNRANRQPLVVSHRGARQEYDDNSATAFVANGNGLAAQLRIVALLDCRKKCVHVDMYYFPQFLIFHTAKLHKKRKRPSPRRRFQTTFSLLLYQNKFT